MARGFTHGLNNEQSGAEFIQSLIPNSHVVKAFSIFENLKNNTEYNLKPAMFFCGDDAQAKSTVSALIASLDWEPLDVGVLKQYSSPRTHDIDVGTDDPYGETNPNLVWGAMRRSHNENSTDYRWNIGDWSRVSQVF